MIECITMTMLYPIISQTTRNRKTKLSPPNLKYSVPQQNYTGNATHTYKPASSISEPISYNVIRLGIRFSNNTQHRLSVTLENPQPHHSRSFLLEMQNLAPKIQSDSCRILQISPRKAQIFPPQIIRP